MRIISAEDLGTVTGGVAQSAGRVRTVRGSGGRLQQVDVGGTRLIGNKGAFDENAADFADIPR